MGRRDGARRCVAGRPGVWYLSLEASTERLPGRARGTGGAHVTTAEVIVVGAGPAGCCAAYHLGRAGVDVLLMDRCTFPREKVCGDALSPTALVTIGEMGLGELAGGAERVSGTYVFAPSGQHTVTYTERPGAVVERRRLDLALLEHARSAGARFLAPRRLKGIRVSGPGVHVETDDGARVAGRAVVLATGANAGALSAAGVLRRAAPAAFGRRAYFEGVDCRPDRIAHCFERFLLPGYGWIFPMGSGRANVGVAGHVVAGRRLDLARRFERFVRASAASRRFLRGARQVSPALTAPLRMGLRGSLLVSGSVLAVGDAGGAAYPLNGEGITSALATGRLAADTLLAALRTGELSSRSLGAYPRRVRQLYGRQFAQADWVKRMMGSPLLINAFVRLTQGDEVFADEMAWTLTGQNSARRLLTRAVAGKVGAACVSAVLDRRGAIH
jgi:geranylgeranyl reductase family protein